MHAYTLMTHLYMYDSWMTLLRRLVRLRVQCDCGVSTENVDDAVYIAVFLGLGLNLD